MDKKQLQEAVKEVIRDGIKIKKFRCLKCSIWGQIDDEQFNGKVSILCDCGFHETINLNEVINEQNEH